MDRYFHISYDCHTSKWDFQLYFRSPLDRLSQAFIHDFGREMDLNYKLFYYAITFLNTRFSFLSVKKREKAWSESRRNRYTQGIRFPSVVTPSHNYLHRSSEALWFFSARVLLGETFLTANFFVLSTWFYLALDYTARSKDVVGRAGRRWRRGTERASCCLTGSRESEARLYVGVTLPYAYLHRLAPSFAVGSLATGPRDRRDSRTLLWISRGIVVVTHFIHVPYNCEKSGAK